MTHYTSEAQFCAGDEVYVVGGGNCGPAVLHFSRDARSVVMVIRGDGLKETVSQYLIDRILASPKVKASDAYPANRASRGRYP